MLANFFSKSKPINFIVIFGLFFCYFIAASFQYFADNESVVYFLSQRLKILGLFLILFFFVNFIISKNNVTFDNSYAFLFFVFLLGLFPETITSSKVIYVNILIFLALRKVYSLHSFKTIFQKLFDAGFWFGISFLVMPFSIVFLVLLYGALYVYQKFTIQTLLIPIIGFIVPVILYFTYCFWYDNLADFERIYSWYTNYNFDFYTTENYYIPLLFVGVFVLISLFIKTPIAFSISNTFKKTWGILIINLLVSVGFLLLLKERNGSELLFLFFPTAIILANGLETIKKEWVKELVLWLFFVGSFVRFFL